MGAPVHMKNKAFSAALLTAAALLLAITSANAHSGGTNAAGCHAGSRPYHCHNGGSGSSSPDRSSTTDRPQQSNQFWRVLSIGDGDTLTVQKGTEQMRIRLACIDAPETAQSYGQSAREELQRLLPIGTPVSIQTVDTDRYGRKVAELFSQGNNINLSLVRTGHAVVYDQYVDGCADKEAYLNAEAIAQQNRLMFWNSSPIVMPWEFRRQRRS